MGFQRTVCYYMGIDYVGTKEQEQIERQTRLRHLCLKQLKDTQKRKPIKSILKKKKCRSTGDPKVMTLQQFLGI